ARAGTAGRPPHAPRRARDHRRALRPLIAMTGSDAAPPPYRPAAARAAAVAALRLVPLGDAAVTIVLGHAIELATNERVHAVAAAVRAAALPWVVDVVPAYASVAVHYDPLHVDGADVLAALEALARATLEGGELRQRVVREHAVPVRYDGVDLEAV